MGVVPVMCEFGFAGVVGWIIGTVVCMALGVRGVVVAWSMYTLEGESFVEFGVLGVFVSLCVGGVLGVW